MSAGDHSSANYTKDDFARDIPVSRETLERLTLYANLLERWQKTLNLVSKTTLSDIWQRHMLDSAQLQAYLPPTEGPIMDLGSGAGFPGLVLAILGEPDVHLIESDQRKGVFLKEAARITQCESVTVLTKRIETIESRPARAVTSRACAPLSQLIDYADRFWSDHTVGLYLKGKTTFDELTDLGNTATLRTDVFPSLSDPNGYVVRVKGMSDEPES